MENLDFFVHEDLFQKSNGYDDFPSEASMFYIVAEDENGRRFALNDSHLYNDEMTNERISQIQEMRISKIKKSIAKGKHLNMSCWREIDPAYGSKAYCDKDSVGYFKMREIEEERA